MLAVMASFWDERYSTDDYLFGTEPNRFLASQRERLTRGAGRRVLALADGEGRNGVWLAGQGLDVTSVEASAIAVAKARRLAESRGVTVHTEIADVTRWDLGDERWDAIVAIFIQFLGSEERRRLHTRVVRALAPGGLLVLQGYTPKQLEHKTGGPPCADNLYTAADLRAELAGLTVVHLEEHEAPLDEGRAHAGMSALVDLVAEKPQRLRG